MFPWLMGSSFLDANASLRNKSSRDIFGRWERLLADIVDRGITCVMAGRQFGDLRSRASTCSAFWCI